MSPTGVTPVLRAPEPAPEICERFFWVLQDANYNVLASVAATMSGTATMVERYEYDPYGRRTVFGHNWLLADMTDDGRVDVSENSLIATYYRLSCAADARWDLNGDGVCDVSDLSRFATGNHLNDGGIKTKRLRCGWDHGDLLKVLAARN